MIRAGIPFCQDAIGPGGLRCELVNEHGFTDRMYEFRTILESVRDTYPNLVFLLNTRSPDKWVSRRVHNCWPHIQDPAEDWGAWFRVWYNCCGAHHPSGGNQECWQGEAGSKIFMPATLPFKAWVYQVCCEGLKFYTDAWTEMHDTVLEVAGSDRVVTFNIEKDDPRILSDALGLGDQHDSSHWRKIHVTRTKRVNRELAVSASRCALGGNDFSGHCKAVQ